MLTIHHSLWWGANAGNISFETLYSGQFALYTQLIIPNYLVILSQPFLQKNWCSDRVFLSTHSRVDLGQRSPIQFNPIWALKAHHESWNCDAVLILGKVFILLLSYINQQMKVYNICLSHTTRRLQDALIAIDALIECSCLHIAGLILDRGVLFNSIQSEH